ncbi:sialic acid-binding Ig-like lectin 7 [Alosa sapidissima]|uniref:sialic acid-binding Ig-like lectin 7 n=1 Tax=Alosa sapidissima TaxID=34773 RepID=UPI001C080BD8|nr:sialic acid-binding Ig-like lectin 7 [Alosa sapidissima]
MSLIPSVRPQLHVMRKGLPILMDPNLQMTSKWSSTMGRSTSPNCLSETPTRGRSRDQGRRQSTQRSARRENKKAHLHSSLARSSFLFLDSRKCAEFKDEVMIFLNTFFFFHLLFFAVGERSYSVSLPERLYALGGFCVVIPCSFDIPDFETKLNISKSINGLWIKGGENFNNLPVVFNGTTNITKLFERIEITGNLHQRDCTTIFYNVTQSHADKYHFRTEMTNELYTFKESFRLIVEDSPLSPQVSEMSEVSEGTSVNLTCTAAAPCLSQSPTITWSLPTGNTHTHIQDEKDGNRSLVSCLTFTASHSHHGRKIYCTASYPRQNGSSVEAYSTVQILRVLFSPVNVVASVSTSGPAAEGSSVTLTCSSSEANPPVQNYTWFRRGQHTPIGSGQTLTFNLSSSDEGQYYCRAEHPQGGKESAAVNLMVTEDKRIFFLTIGVSGGSLAIVVLMAVLIICAKRWNKPTLHHEDEHNSECETSATCDEEGPAHTYGPKPTEDQQVELHYGEINLSKLPLRDTREGQEQGPGQETEYAEVRLSGRDVSASDQTGLDKEELYAKVQK